MTWSMTSVSYRMSGNGTWQNLLPDDYTRRLYADIYPDGITIPPGGEGLYRLLSDWREAGIVGFKDGKAAPLGPIMTENDLSVMTPWFEDIADYMFQSVRKHLDEFNALSRKLIGGGSRSKQELDNILTIQVCAHTLDSWVFARLREKVMGQYPPRGLAGTFFFWGYAFAGGPRRIFGFTTYGGRGMLRIHVIRSRGLNRESLKDALSRREVWEYLARVFTSGETGRKTELFNPLYLGKMKNTLDLLTEVRLIRPDDPSSLAIPVFSGPDLERAGRLYDDISAGIVDYLIAGLDDLKALKARCSFAGCSRADTLCMLFHLAYSFATDKLAARGLIPEFPVSAGGEWGVWVH